MRVFQDGDVTIMLPDNFKEQPLYNSSQSELESTNVIVKTRYEKYIFEAEVVTSRSIR